MKPEDSEGAKRGQSLALAAALAMLGMSVGVNVQALLAASPTDAVPSTQNKIGHEGVKRDASQISLPCRTSGRGSRA
jgi:hypothetical protein